MTVRFAASGFAREVAEKSRAHLERCSQCLTCGAGCPVAFALDYTPNRIARMVQLGMRERVLDSSAIWLCASCQACTARCPYGVDVVRMMDVLRQMALREGRVHEKSVAAFDAAFLASVRERGRVQEPSLMARYTFSGGDVLRRLPGYLSLGLKMLRRGKLNITGKTAGRTEVRRMFKRSGL